MRIAYHVMSAPGPLGLLFLAATERGLRYLEFLDKRSIKRAIDSHRDENPGAEWNPSLIELKPVVDQLEAYFCGALKRFDLPLDPVGSEFQLEVWNALCEIPHGETRSYGQIAKAIHQPKAMRAVGLANNQNPLVIVVPCHRVIGADGSLTGYGGGLPRKRWLLAHETHFGAVTGVTLDLFVGATAAPPNRLAAGDGPPLGVTRATAASVKKPVAVSRKPAPVRVAAPAPRATVTASRTPVKTARVAKAAPPPARPTRGKTASKPSARTAPSKTARGSGRGPARPARSTRRASR